MYLVQRFIMCHVDARIASSMPLRMIPYARTLRKAREQIKCMVIDGASPRRIRNYLHLWTRWWANASDTWVYHEILQWFVDACWDISPAAYAAGLIKHHFNKLHTETSSLLGVAA